MPLQGFMTFGGDAATTTAMPAPTSHMRARHRPAAAIAVSGG
jgi:hypothetical protein